MWLINVEESNNLISSALQNAEVSSVASHLMTYMPILKLSHFMKHTIKLRWGIFGDYTFQAYKTRTDTETNVFLLSPPEGMQSCLFILAFCILLREATVSLLLSSPSVYPKHPSLPL